MQRRGTATVAAASATSSSKTNIDSSSSAALATNNNGGGGCGDGDDDDDAIDGRRRRRKKTRRASSRCYCSDGARLLLVMATLGGGTILLPVFYSRTPRHHSRPSVGDNYETRKRHRQRGTTRRDSSSVGGDDRATAAASNTQQQRQQQQRQQHVKHSIDEQQQRRRRRNESRINRISSSTAATDIIDTVVGTVSPTTNTTLHVIFSTDCSTYQQWQSYLFFYSAYAIGQPGYITRIVSGCDDDDDDDDAGGSSSSKKKKEDEELLWHNIHVRHVMSDRFRIHFTPKFSTVKEYDEEESDGGGGGKGKKEYKFFNKPFGLLHFLENNDLLGTTTTTTTKEDEEYVKNDSSTMTMMKKMIHPNDIIILVDPDFLLLRPITDDFSNSNTTLISKRRAQFYNQQRNNNNYGKNIVTHGQPYAQAYGLGTQWRKFNISHIAGRDSPAKDVSRQDGFLYYPVGPPYIATARDMYHIAITWSTFVIRVHDEYPHLLAEMFAYCIAVAHLHLPHVIIDSLMITTAGIGGEGWKYINNIPSSEVCIVASNYHNYTRKTYHNSSSQHTRYDYILPNAIHYCQSYTVDKYMFSKRRVPHDIFTATCNHPLLVEPPMDLGMGHYPSYSRTKGAPIASMTPEKEHMEAFMVCALTNALNNAMKFFKEHSSSSTSAGGNTCIVDERNRNKAYSIWEGGMVEI